MTYIIVIVTCGLIVGSFISAITWRLPRGMNFVNDRSRCDVCGKKIHWYDNIPLFSYLILGGKCRDCGKKISIRYPLIEFSTGIVFVFVATQDNLLNGMYQGLGFWGLPYLLFVSTLMLAVFVTDFELQIIPDEFAFFLFGISLIIFPLFLRDLMYEHLFSGFLMALFLLILHLGTKGRGMGLGDVKLALFAGSFFGLKYSISWIFLSFILGAFVGLLLLAMKKAEFGKKIAFGPFLVLSFFLMLFWSGTISKVLLPYF